MVALGFILGAILGMFCMAVISIDRINEYESAIHTQKMLIRNRDRFIGDQVKTIKGLEKMVKSLKEENESIRQEAYKTVKTKKRVITSDQTNK